MRGFHTKIQCMKNTIDQLKKILEHNNISLPQGAEMCEAREKTEEYERCHSLKEGFT